MPEFSIFLIDFFRYACLFISINSERQHFGVEYRFGEGILFHVIKA